MPIVCGLMWKAKARKESVDVTIYVAFDVPFFLWIICIIIDVSEIVEFAALVWNKMVTKKFSVSWWTGSIFIGGSRPGNAKRIFSFIVGICDWILDCDYPKFDRVWTFHIYTYLLDELYIYMLPKLCNIVCLGNALLFWFCFKYLITDVQ